MTRVRRARALTIAWQDSALVAHNYCSRRSAPVTPRIVDILDYCDQWRTPADVFATFSTTERPILRQTLRLLVEQTFLDRTTTPLAADRDALDSWNTWGPAAAFFHFATKDGTYEPEHVSRKRLVSKARVDPPPPPTKTYGDTARTPLPHVNGCDGLGTVLRARRTWRRFGAAPLDTTVLATLLGLTWGVQSWAETTIGACALKTSPSGGARHPIEVYLLARRVSGISPGVYYYDPDAHDLVLVKRGLTARRLEAYLAGQSCYADAPAVFVMTAVFARMQWRYRVCARVSGGAARRRSPVPDVLPDRDVARAGAVLHGGAGRHAPRARLRDRRRHRVGHLCVRRWSAAGRRDVGAVAGYGIGSAAGGAGVAAAAACGRATASAEVGRFTPASSPVLSPEHRIRTSGCSGASAPPPS